MPKFLYLRGELLFCGGLNLPFLEMAHLILIFYHSHCIPIGILGVIDAEPMRNEQNKVDSGNLAKDITYTTSFIFACG
jgi:hypothetical protein